MIKKLITEPEPLPFFQCERRVDLGEYNKWYIERRKEKCRKRDLDPEFCTARAHYEVEGEKLCARHAQKKALKILLRNTSAT